MGEDINRKPNIYNQGKIYAIKNNVNDDVYIGSTTQPLSKRFNDHKKNLKDNSKYNRCSVYKKMVELGKENFYIELIEDYPCETKEELLIREGQLIRELGTLNQQIMGRTLHEQQLEYRQNNKEKLKQKQRNYYLNNKEEVDEKCRVYREENKDKINQKKAEYRETNRDEIRQKANEKIQCLNCKVFVRRGGMARHMKTDKRKSSSIDT